MDIAMFQIQLTRNQKLRVLKTAIMNGWNPDLTLNEIQNTHFALQFVINKVFPDTHPDTDKEEVKF